MEYEDEEIAYGDSGMISPLQMLMGAGFSTVTPEGKARAAQVFEDLYSRRSAYDEEEAAAYDEYETRAREARDVLRRARETLAAKKTPTTKWLELAKGFGAPTRAGSFGESISNYADARIPGKQREADWEQNRDQQLLGFDTGMNTIDQQLAMQRLKLRQAKRGADDKLMLESMKIMGKPTPITKPPRTPERVAQEALDKAYVKDYVEFIQGGAADATKNIEELTAAHRALSSSDMKTGPIIGSIPKALRDIFMPKASETQEGVESTVQRSLRQILGAQFTEKEGERLLARVYNPRLPEEINAARVARLIEQLDRAYKEKIAAAEYFEANGTLTGYKGKKAWSISEFLPDEEVDDDPAAIAKDLQNTLTGRGSAPKPQRPALPPQQGGPAPDEGMEEIPIEALLPAMARGGRIKKRYAEGGKAKSITSGINAYKRYIKNSYLKWSGNKPPESQKHIEQFIDEGHVPEMDDDNGHGYTILEDWYKKKHKFAEGGPVEGEFPDGRLRYQMPDGKVINARPGDTYEFVLDLYTRATGTAPSRPGVPPQQIPPLGGSPPATMQPAAPPAAQAPIGLLGSPSEEEEEDPSLMDTALEELPSGLGYAGAGAAGAAVANKVLPAVGDRLIPGRGESPAQRRVLDMLQEQSRHPRDVAAGVRQQQKMGVPAMAMDDPALRRTADSALAESGLTNSTEILNRLRARQDNIGERVMDQVNQGLKPDEYFEQLDVLKDSLYKNSKPLYDKAYAQNPAIKSKVLPQLLETPDGKRAVKIALRLMRNSGKQIGKQDAMGMVQAPSLEFLDNVKRGLDQLITKEEGQGGNYQATPLGKSMRELRDALRNELDVATTPKKGDSLYKLAREQYAGDLEVLDALQEGREDFTKLQPKQLEKRVAAMSFAEKDAYRTGVAQRLFETIETPSADFNAAQRIIGSPAQAKKLRLLFDNDKQFELFKTALEKESELFELSKRSIRQGEAGQALHAEPADSPIKRAARHVPRLGWKSPTMWILQFIRNNSKATEAKMDDVLTHLKASTPEELADLEKTLGPKFDRRISRKGRAGKAAAIGAVLGAGAKIADAAMADEEDDDAEQE